MVLKSHRESAPGYASVPSTLCRFSIVSTLPLSAALHASGRRPDPTSGCWREQGGGITNSKKREKAMEIEALTSLTACRCRGDMIEGSPAFAGDDNSSSLTT